MSGTIHVDLTSGVQSEYDDGMVTICMDERQAITLHGFLRQWGYDSADLRGIRRALFDALNMEEE